MGGRVVQNEASNSEAPLKSTLQSCAPSNEARYRFASLNLVSVRSVSLNCEKARFAPEKFESAIELSLNT